MTTRIKAIFATPVVLSAIVAVLMYLTPFGSQSTGPLGSNGTPPQECIPVKDGTATYALIYLHNSGNQPVKVTGVTLVDPRGITLLQASVGSLWENYGAWLSYPPTKPWVHVPATGAVIPAHSGKPLWLILGLKLTDGGSGSFTGLRLYYSSTESWVHWWKTENYSLTESSSSLPVVTVTPNSCSG